MIALSPTILRDNFIRIQQGRGFDSELIDEIEDQTTKFVINSLLTGLELVYRGNYGEASNQLKNCRVQIETLHREPNELESFVCSLSKLYIAEIYWRESNINTARSILNEVKQKAAFFEEDYQWLWFEYCRISSIITFLRGKIDKSIEFLKEGILLAKDKQDTMYHAILENTLGYIYRIQGVFDRAKELHNNSLSILEEYELKPHIANCVENLAVIDFSLQNLPQAKNYFEQAINLRTEIGDLFYLSWSLFNYCLIYLEFDIPSVRSKYEQLIKISELSDNVMIRERAKLIAGLIMKLTKRYSTKVKSKNILLDIRNNTTVYENSTIATLAIIEILIEEYEHFKDLSILEEVEEYIDELLSISIDNSSYSMVFSLYLLQARLDLLQNDFTASNRMLTRAKEVYFEHNLTAKSDILTKFENYMIEYQNEERFQNYLNLITDEFSAKKITRHLVSHRSLAFAMMDEYPLGLLILNSHGTLIISYAVEELLINDHLVANFLSAILSFSEEFSSQMAEEGEFTRDFQVNEYEISLIKDHNLIFAYIYRGISISVYAKFKNMVENLLSDSKIQSILSHQEIVVTLTESESHYIKQAIAHEFQQLIETEGNY